MFTTTEKYEVVGLGVTRDVHRVYLEVVYFEGKKLSCVSKHRCDDGSFPGVELTEGESFVELQSMLVEGARSPMLAVSVVHLNKEIFSKLKLT